MKKLLMTILLCFMCFQLNAAPAVESLGFADEETGKSILSEYVEQCREIKTGKFIACPDTDDKTINRKIKRQCRNPETGRFVKCPAKS